MEDGLTSVERDKEANERRRLDELDYNDAISGRDSGRMSRFGGASRKREEREKKKAEKAFRDALERLLQDPEYRALYEELGNTLGEAEQHADQVIANLQADLADVQRQIDQMLDAAPQLPGGTRVFRFADGRVIDEHGQEIAPEIAEGIIWPPGAPSAEDYLANRDRELALNDLLEQWHDYRNDTLGGIRDRYDDRDNPMSKGDLRDAIEHIQSATPTASLEAAVVETPVAEPAVTRPNFALPPIGQ